MQQASLGPAPPGREPGDEEAARLGLRCRGHPERTKAVGEKVTLTLRLTREQWERTHQLARAEGIILNQLALHALSGCSRNAACRGL